MINPPSKHPGDVATPHDPSWPLATPRFNLNEGPDPSLRESRGPTPPNDIPTPRSESPKMLRADAFTHRYFYTQTLLHTNTFTHRRFYTQALLHTDDFTHRRTILHTDAFTHKRFYTQTLLHSNTLRTLWNRNFTAVFDDRTSFRAKG